MLLQVAAKLLLACDASQEGPAVQLYRLLSGAGEGSCSPALHAAGVRAYLRDAHNSAQSLEAALQVLEAHAEPLLALQDEALAGAVAAAAAQCLPTMGRSSAAGTAAAALASWGVAIAAAAEASADRRYAALQPPVRATLWSLRLLAACDGTDDAALHAAARQAVGAVADAAGGGQLLLLLELLPARVGGLQPAAGHCDALLRCAVQEGVLAPSCPLRAAVAEALARVCSPLRNAGPSWAAALTRDAQVTAAALPLPA